MTLRLTLALLAALSGCRCEPSPGKALFYGDTPLVARIAGHESALPPNATRCANCHVPGEDVKQTDSGAFGPILDLGSLTALRSRRGAPPSRFDSRSFCTLLRTGVDPAYVLITRDMPRYELTETECNELWQHVTRGAP